jgi:hypothetical protein
LRWQRTAYIAEAMGGRRSQMVAPWVHDETTGSRCSARFRPCRFSVSSALFHDASRSMTRHDISEWIGCDSPFASVAAGVRALLEGLDRDV